MPCILNSSSGLPSILRRLAKPRYSQSLQPTRFLNKFLSAWPFELRIDGAHFIGLGPGPGLQPSGPASARPVSAWRTGLKPGTRLAARRRNRAWATCGAARQLPPASDRGAVQALPAARAGAACGSDRESVPIFACTHLQTLTTRPTRNSRALYFRI